MKKKTLIIVISIVVVLLIVAGVLTYLMLGTDIFKSEKELFAKYSSQVINEDEFFPKAIVDYETKKEMVAYESNGTLSADTEIKGDATSDTTLQEIQSVIGYGNNTNITFNGKVDKANRKLEESFVVNYTDTVNFPFTVKQDGDRYGLLVNGISATNYVAVDNNNIPGLMQALGISDVEGVPNKIEMPNIESLNFSEEEKTHIQEAYFTPMFEGITEDKFTKIKNEDGSVSYELNITAEEFKNILSQMLQTLSTDTAMINKINSFYTEMQEELSVVESQTLSSYASSYYDSTDDSTSEGITPDNILKTKSDLDNETWVGNIRINVTENHKETNKFVVELIGVDVSRDTETSTSIASDTTEEQNSMLFEITKVQSNPANSSYGYTITGTYNGITYATANINYAELNTNNPKENITFTVGNPNYLTTTFSYSKNITFGNAVTIDGFDNTTTVVINNYQSNQLLPFLIQYASSVIQLNTNQMTQIGYPTELVNPLLLWIAAPSTSLNQVENASDNLTNTNLNTQEANTYNAQFIDYEGNVSGVQAKTLVDTVKQHNLVATDNADKIQVLTLPGNSIVNTSEVSISNTDQAYLDTVNASLQTASTYNVSFGYDSTTNKITTIYITSLTNEPEISAETATNTTSPETTTGTDLGNNNTLL